MVRRRVDDRADSGTALIEFIWLGLLLLVPLVYIMVAVSQVQGAAYGVSTASRAAGRAFVLAPDVGAARERAEQAALIALADQGIEARTADIAIECVPSCLVPGSTVKIVVTVRQRLPLAPDALGAGAPSVTVDSTHVEPYGTFREARS